MHVVTKILVVFAAILAVLLAGLTMAYSINADTIVSGFRGEREARERADQLLGAAETRHGEERGLLQDQIQALQSELASRDERIIQLEAEVAQLRTDKRDAEIAAERYANQIGQSLETTRVQATMMDNYRQEIAQLRDQELATREQMIQLEDALNDAESRNEVLVQQTRSLQEQLTELENQVAMGGGGGEGSLGGEAFGTLRTIKGRVIEARKDQSTGQTLVEIDVGENDGVEVGMTMAAYRGRDNYLGSIEIIRVDLQTAVGRVQFLDQDNEAIKADDRVATNIR